MRSKCHRANPSSSGTPSFPTSPGRSKWAWPRRTSGGPRTPMAPRRPSSPRGRKGDITERAVGLAGTPACDTRASGQAQVGSAQERFGPAQTIPEYGTSTAPRRGGPMTQIEEALTDADLEVDEAEADEVLVEEISIDGMCGVY